MRLNNHDIICIGFPPWDGDYMKSTILLMKELAKYNNVLYVEYPFSWTDVYRGLRGQVKRPIGRILGTQSRLFEVRVAEQRNLHVLTLPPVLPLKWVNHEGAYDYLSRINASIAQKAIWKALKKLAFSPSICVNAFNPFLGNFLVGVFKEKRLVYYCYDQIEAARWAGKHGPRLEKEFIPKTDAIITSSSSLHEVKSPMAKESFLIKNGVDFDLFSQALELPPTHYTPTVGYIGSLDDRLNYTLIRSLLEHMPDIRFLFVGRVTAPSSVEQLKAFSNFEWVPPQVPEMLPGFLGQMQVGIIPFEINAFTKHIYPLKINEYLAAGLSVVSTPFSDLSDFERYIHIQSDEHQFREAILTAMQQNSPKCVKERQELAKEHSWERRAAHFGDALYDLLYELAL